VIALNLMNSAPALALYLFQISLYYSGKGIASLDNGAIGV
jgi:hypothetical protein